MGHDGNSVRHRYRMARKWIDVASREFAGNDVRQIDGGCVVECRRALAWSEWGPFEHRPEAEESVAAQILSWVLETVVDRSVTDVETGHRCHHRHRVAEAHLGEG